MRHGEACADSKWTQCVNRWQLESHRVLEAWASATLSEQLAAVNETEAALSGLQDAERAYSAFSIAALFWLPLLAISASYAATILHLQANIQGERATMEEATSEVRKARSGSSRPGSLSGVGRLQNGSAHPEPASHHSSSTLEVIPEEGSESGSISEADPTDPRSLGQRRFAVRQISSRPPKVSSREPNGNVEQVRGWCKLSPATSGAGKRSCGFCGPEIRRFASPPSSCPFTSSLGMLASAFPGSNGRWTARLPYNIFALWSVVDKHSAMATFDGFNLLSNLIVLNAVLNPTLHFIGKAGREGAGQPAASASAHRGSNNPDLRYHRLIQQESLAIASPLIRTGRAALRIPGLANRLTPAAAPRSTTYGVTQL